MDSIQKIDEMIRDGELETTASFISISCGKCGRLTPFEQALVDKQGILIKCKHCGVVLDREKLFKSKHFPDEIHDRQLELNF
jgi:ribosomal protein S27E